MHSMDLAIDYVRSYGIVLFGKSIGYKGMKSMKNNCRRRYYTEYLWAVLRKCVPLTG